MSMPIDNGRWAVTIPVTLWVEDQTVVAADVDYDEAPWPMVSAGGNVYDPLTSEWVDQEDVASFGNMWLQGVLDELNLTGDSGE